MASNGRSLVFAFIFVLVFVEFPESTSLTCEQGNCDEHGFSSGPVERAIPKRSHCGRYACIGRKREERQSSSDSWLENPQNEKQTIEGNIHEDNRENLPSKRKPKKGFRWPCWRFGCRKRFLKENESDMLKRFAPARTERKEHFKSLPQQDDPKPKQDCFRFGCKKRAVHREVIPGSRSQQAMKLDPNSGIFHQKKHQGNPRKWQ